MADRQPPTDRYAVEEAQFDQAGRGTVFVRALEARVLVMLILPSWVLRSLAFPLTE